MIRNTVVNKETKVDDRLPRIQSRIGVLAAICFIFCSMPVNLLSSSDAGEENNFGGSGWNTWDMGRPNAMVYMPDGIGLELTLYDPETGHSFGRPFLKDVQHFGAHAPDGSYCYARYKQGTLTYEVEFARHGNSLVAHVRPLMQTRYLLIAEVSFFFGRTGAVQKQRDGLVVRGKSSTFYVASPDKQISPPNLTIEHRMVVDLTGDRWVTLTNQPPRFNSAAVDQAWVDAAREGYEKVRVRSDGFLADGAQAAVDVAAWNMVWNPRRDMPVTTVAREWPGGSGFLWGGYLQGGWDAVFQSILADLESGQMAEASIRGLLADVTPGGYIPNIATGWGMTEDHSEPPLMSFALLKIYKMRGRREILEEAFPPLYRWHQWWFTARDGNQNGLLEWGSNPISSASFDDYLPKEISVLTSVYKQMGIKPPSLQPSDMMNNRWVAMCESGLENSHMWDGVEFNKQTHTLEQDEVGLNSVYALDASALSEIAHILGRGPEEQKLRQESRDMGDRINQMLWSEEDGIYLNRRWNGSFNRSISLTNFFPLLAGIASPERAKRMVDGYLLNPQKFWGENVVPVIPRDEPWTGEIMGSTNYLVYEGLKRSGFDEVASEVAAKSCRIFLEDWRVSGHIQETYNAKTGKGEDMHTPSSTTYYAWGGLLPLIMVEELIDVEPWASGLRFGSLSPNPASISNFRVMNDSYDVFSGPGLRVIRNGQRLIESDFPVVLRNAHWERDRVRFDVTATRDVRLTLHGFVDGEKIFLKSPYGRQIVPRGGSVVIMVGPQVKTVDIDRRSL
jgi:hypothetical protein